MNCKKHDLARIVPDMKVDEWTRGCIVRCVALDAPDEHGAVWLIEPEIEGPHGRCYAVSDSILRPLPPSDISDEDVRDLYAPSDETDLLRADLRQWARTA